MRMNNAMEILDTFGLDHDALEPINDLGDDFHINFMINGAFEFPAYAISLLLVRYCGRRVPNAVSLALSGKLWRCIT